jgi:spore coat protein A
MKGMHYSTEEKCPGNSAVYIYPNEQDAGNHWFHDHTFGITRLNVYAGLAGLYKIVDLKNNK